jgi:hypothetical protein
VAMTEVVLGGVSINIDDISHLSEVPAIADLKMESAAIVHLNSNTSDAGIPRVSMVGDIPIRNAVFRIRQSLANDDAGFNHAVMVRNVGMSAFKSCKVVGYVFLVTARQGRICARAATVLGRVDDRWARYVNGATLQTRYAAGMPYQTWVSRAVPFDGVVSNERSHYPGSSALPVTVQDVNHQNIYSARASLNILADQMVAIGMTSTSVTGPLAASISGPSSLEFGATGTWTASVSGGSPAYRYSWSGFLTGQQSSVSGTGSGTLTLDVTDLAGSHVTTNIFVAKKKSTTCGTQFIC